MMLLQQEIDQSQRHNQQQQSSTVMMQPTGPVQPVIYVLRSSSAPAYYESYNRGQSMVAGIILIIAGVFSIIFNILSLVFFEPWTIIGHGFWCGVMVSW